MNVTVSEEALEQLRLFAAAQRVTVSALVDALGQELGRVDRPLPAWAGRLVRTAGEVTASRRRRS